ncbi:hypothetical protein THAOC_12470, partial [Thalassiosira oceanica]
MMRNNIALPAALGAFLASHQVGAFLTPRIAAGLAPPSRSVPISTDGTEQLRRCIINGQPRVNGICLFAESSGSDDNEELETEASTTTVLEAKNMGPDLSEDVS